MIFVDADALIGLRVKEDAHYNAAKQILNDLEEKGETLATSWQVVNEVATKLAYFDKKKNALDFLKWLFKSDVEVVYVDSRLAKKAVKKFKDQRSKRVSLTDCTNMVIAEEMGVKQIFSFDKHYEQNGLELLK
ncbi:PIN domain-containing protein [Patescibacteria group bacterium]|nr:PIN domain-containing protein [Patescibacteria group bacterium]